MNWKKIGQIIGKASPLIGTAIGGPAGPLIGTLVANALDVEPTPNAVDKAIKSDPDALIKLKQLEIDRELQLTSAALETTKAELADKQNARHHHKDSKMPAILCVLATILVALTTAALFYVAIPSNNEKVIYLVVGVIIGVWQSTVAYWVGTTRSSADKTKLLKQENGSI